MVSDPARNFAQTLKQQADIVRIIGEYVRLRKAGAQNYSGLCPFHSEKSPSFSVHAARQFYHCFGCGESGDVFSFLQKIENLTFGEAIKSVAQKSGVPLPKREFNSAEDAAESRQRQKLLELHELATIWFEQQLQSAEGAAAREYLTGRGLTPQGIAKFRIGFAPDSFNGLRERLKGTADDSTLRASGLFSFKEQEDGTQGPLYSRFRKRVMFPIANESGRIIAFTARALDTGDKAGPKYLNSPETPLYSKGHVLFNLDKAKQPIREAKFVLLVEGQMDCISAYLAGISNVIATSGTAFTEAQVRLLRRHTTQVLVNFDPDTAGANAAEKSIALLTEEDFQVKVVTLEEGLDPDRFIRERGVPAYMAALRGARRHTDYLIERARLLFPPVTADAKVKALNFLLPHIRRVPSRIARDEFAADAAQKLGIDSALVREELKQAAAKRRDHLAPLVSLTESEKVVLRAFAAPAGDPAFLAAFDAVENHPGHFEGLTIAPLLKRLAERGEADPMTVIEDAGERAVLAQVLIGELQPVTPEDVAGALEALHHRSLEQRQRSLRTAIAEAARKGDEGAVVRLTAEKLTVDRMLRELS